MAEKIKREVCQSDLREWVRKNVDPLDRREVNTKEGPGLEVQAPPSAGTSYC